MPTNREIIEAFAAAFDPPLAVAGTDHIDGKSSPGAYMAASAVACVTAIVHGEGFLALHFDRPDVALAAALGRAIGKREG